NYTIGNGAHELGSVFDDAGMLRAAAHHKAGNILKKEQRNLFLVAEHNKPGCFICAVIINNPSHLHLPFLVFYDLPLVRYNTHGPAIYPGISANNRLTIIIL